MRLLCNICLTIQFRFKLSNPSFQYWYRLSSCVIPISKLALNVFISFEMDTLKKVYFFLYPDLDQGNIIFPDSYQKYSQVICNNNRYGSSNSKNLRSSYIVAYWCKDGGEIAKYNKYDTTPSPGTIRYLLKHSIIVNNRCFEHWFAYCDWFHPVNTNIRYSFGKPVEVWYRNLFKQFGTAFHRPV